MVNDGQYWLKLEFSHDLAMDLITTRKLLDIIAEGIGILFDQW